MTSEEARDRYFAENPLDKRGYPVIRDATDPCWSLWQHDWPGLTAEEAAEIVRKTRKEKPQ